MITLRQLLRKQLARDNTNIDCLKIIQSLPGDSSLTDMVQACAHMGTIGHEITTLAAAMWHQKKMSGGGEQKRGRTKDKYQQKPHQQKAGAPAFLCAKCKKPGHYANQCKSRKPVAG